MADFVANPTFQTLRCYNDPTAAGYVASLDASPDSPALCATEQALKDLCWSIESCYGVSMHSTTTDRMGAYTQIDRGYLNTYACAGNMAIRGERGTMMFTKDAVTTGACPLGNAVEIAGGNADYAVRGVYEKASDSLYEMANGLSKVKWHHSNCGWVVARANVDMVAHRAAMSRRLGQEDEQCEDQSHLLAQVLGAEEQGLCAQLATGWGHEGYCAQPAFAKLCPETCEASCTDDAAGLCDKKLVCDDLDRALCPASCAGKEMSTSTTAAGKQAHRRASIRFILRDALLTWKHKAQNVLRDVRQAESTVRRLHDESMNEWRRLGIEHDYLYEEVYRTWDESAQNRAFTLANGSATTICHAMSDPRDDLLSGMLYDVLAYHSPVDVTMDHACPSVMTYVTVNDTYCQRDNVNVQHSTVHELVDNSCYVKCGDTKFSDTIVDGMNDWCSGNVFAFTPETNALCLPREKCEELCTDLGDECSSIDMHRYLPRCYLNAKHTAETGPCERIYNTTYDLLDKQMTPDATDGPNDAGRVTWTTYTSKRLAVRRNSSYAIVDMRRDECEASCAADASCFGFELFTMTQTVDAEGFAGLPKCAKLNYPCDGEDGRGARCTHLQHDDMMPGYLVHFLGVQDDPDVPLSASTTVLKDLETPCTITLSGGSYDNVVLKKKPSYCTYETCYLSDDNSTRVIYEPGVNTSTTSWQEDSTCDSWTVESNAEMMVTVTLENCSDNAAMADVYFKHYGQNVLSAGSTYPDGASHPCQWAADYDVGGVNLCDDPVVRGLCPHTCSPLQITVIAGVPYKHQDTRMPDSTPEHSNSTCDGDNHMAAYTFMKLWPTVLHVPDKTMMTDKNACEHVINNTASYNLTHAPCVQMPWSGIFRTLCKSFCMDWMDPPPPPLDTSTMPDESSSTGAVYNFNHRRLQMYGLTESDMGHGPGFYMTTTSVTASYLPGNQTETWVPKLQSFVNSSTFIHSPYAEGASISMNMDGTLSVIPGTPCAMGTPKGSQAMYDLLDRDTMYPATVEHADPPASIDHHCRSSAACPGFFTCVAQPMRLNDELDGQFTTTGRKNFIGSIPLAQRRPMLDFAGDTFLPKVLMSEYRATATVLSEGSKFLLTPRIARNMPGAPVMTLQDLDSAYSMVISTVSATAGGGYYAQEELSVSFDEPPFYDPFITDVMRIESFNETGSVATSGITFELDVGDAGANVGTLFTLFEVVGGSLVNVEDRGGSVVHITGGKFTVTLASVNADFVGAAAVDMCMDDPCDPMATCAPLRGGEVECTCPEGYVSSGETEGHFCALKPDSYTNGAYFIRLTNTDPVNFGWHIKEVALTGTGCALASFPVETDSVTYDAITSTSKVYTGQVGKSHYPHPTDVFEVSGVYPNDANGNPTGPTFMYGNSKLVDGNMNTEWWSECLNCAPGSTSIEVILPAGCILKEVTVTQAEHYASSYSIERGPAMGPDCGMGEMDARCAPSMTWEVYVCGTDADCPAAMPKCWSNTAGGRAAGQCGARCSDADPADCSAEADCTDTRVASMCPCNCRGNSVFAVAGGKGVITTDTEMACGFEDTQTFGEVLYVMGDEAWQGSYANNMKVNSPCQCHQLCIDHLAAGCRSWKFYEEDAAGGIKHCYLQGPVFGPGEGWYGKGMAKWPDWTSGTPQLRYRKDGVTTGETGGVVGTAATFEKPWLLAFTASAGASSGQPFELTVTGTMPYSAVKAEDYSGLQRVKLVPTGASCAVKVPKEISGLSCVKSSKKTAMLGGTTTESIYTLCGPRPSAADADAVTFSNIAITPTTAETSYDVCYCAYDCFEPGRWQRVPGSLTVDAAVFTWATTPDMIYRKDAQDAKITITRPAFGSHSMGREWDLKLVRDFFTCEEAENSNLFAQSFVDCDGPDVCTWEYALTFAVEDVGRYLVCFKETNETSWYPIPSTVGGLKFLEVHKLSADHTHPRGIFHNQYFSSLAGGAAQEMTVTGYRVPIPSYARVTLTAGTCGDLSDYAFPGSVVKPPTVDTVAPILDLAATYPANTSTIAASEVIGFAFSEPVQIHEGCLGSFLVLDSDGSVAKALSCSDERVVAYGNKIAVAFGNLTKNSTDDLPLTPGDYSLAIETDALSDLAGNRILYQMPGLMVTVAGLGAETVAPSVLRTDPMHGYSVDGSIISIYFSEDVAPSNESVSIQLCGSDFECDVDDPVVNSYPVTADMVNGSALTVDLGRAVKDFQRYKITVPAGTMTDMGGTKGPAAPYSFEFVRDSKGFKPANTIELSPGASTGDGLVFHLELGADTTPGNYAVCFCAEKDDPTLLDLGDGDTTFVITDNQLCSINQHLDISGSSTTVLSQTLSDHTCSTKCGEGCIGPHCFCDGSASAPAGALCLSKELCAAACDGEAGCAGINVHDTLPHCILIETNCTGPMHAPAGPAGLEPEEYQFFEKKMGTACTDFSDFSEQAGRMTVTNRVHVGVDYVFSPGDEASIELTSPEGASLTYYNPGSPDASSTGLSRDRIMVIDCGGTCGVSGPTRSLEKPAMANKMKTWNNHWPHASYNDLAHVDAENPVDPDKVVESAAGEQLSMYASRASEEGHYYAGYNIDIFKKGADAIKIAIDGDMRDLNEYQCYNMCAMDACTGAHCKCDGFLNGYDGPTSNALCADRALCGYICDQVEGCDAIDMHKTISRCFLNGFENDEYATYKGALTRDENYDVLHPVPANEETLGGRRLQQPLLAPRDIGFSWDRMLRFTGIQFATGGSFKLCFCDSSLLPSGAGAPVPCSSEEDYSVEVGTIHSSGVQCLLEKPKLRRASCKSQYHGGLRCYNDMEAPDPPPPAIGPLTDRVVYVEGENEAPEGATNCAFSPEEEGCQPEPQSGNAAPPR